MTYHIIIILLLQDSLLDHRAFILIQVQNK